MPAANSILRVLRPVESGTTTPVGAAVLLPGNQLLTASHVVNLALDREPTDGSRPSATIGLDFPLIEGVPTVSAHVVRWKDPFHGDLATLDVDDLPDGAEPARLAADREPSRAARVRVAGFPESAPDGIWVEGRLAGQLMGGLVQIDDAQLNEHTIEPGFSGSGIWLQDQDILVGIVVQANPKRRVSAMAPSAMMTERFRASEPQRGTDNWKLTYFRKNGLGAFLVDLGDLCRDGLEPHCASVQERLEAITNHLTDVGDFADWQVTPDAAFSEFRRHYVHWNDQGNTNARLTAMEAVREAKWAVSEKLRQPQNLLFQQDLDDPLDSIFDELDSLANIAAGQLFPRVRRAVDTYRSRV